MSFLNGMQCQTERHQNETHFFFLKVDEEPELFKSNISDVCITLFPPILFVLKMSAFYVCCTSDFIFIMKANTMNPD